MTHSPNLTTAPSLVAGRTGRLILVAALAAEGAGGAGGHDDTEGEDGRADPGEEAGEADVFVIRVEPAVADAPDFPNEEEDGGGSVFAANFLSGRARSLRELGVHELDGVLVRTR